MTGDFVSCISTRASTGRIVSGGAGSSVPTMQPDNKNPLAKSRPVNRHNQASPDDFPSGLFTFIAFILVSYHWIEHTPVPSGACGNVRFLCSVFQIYKGKKYHYWLTHQARQAFCFR